MLELLQQGRWFGALDPALQQLIVQSSRVVRFATSVGPFSSTASDPSSGR